MRTEDRRNATQDVTKSARRVLVRIRRVIKILKIKIILIMNIFNTDCTKIRGAGGKKLFLEIILEEDEAETEEIPDAQPPRKRILRRGRPKVSIEEAQRQEITKISKIGRAHV